MKTIEFLTEHFGKSGEHYFNVVRGIHLSEVKPIRIRKSLSAEHTFDENISSETFMLDHLKYISEAVEKRLKRAKVAGKTITLKIKYSDFTQQTCSKTIFYFIGQKPDFRNCKRTAVPGKDEKFGTATGNWPLQSKYR